MRDKTERGLERERQTDRDRGRERGRGGERRDEKLRTRE